MDALDAFSPARLWAPSGIASSDKDFESALFAPLDLDIPALRCDNPYAPKHDLADELRLPDLDTFEFGPLPDLASPPESLPELEQETEAVHVSVDADVWEEALDAGPADRGRFLSWDALDDDHQDDHNTPPYLSERGPRAFEATLATDTQPGRPVHTHVLLTSLWNLGLGRSSLLFVYNPTTRAFEPTLPDARPHAVSPCAAASIIAQFLHTGNTTLYLRAFAERAFGSPESLPARVALATAVSTLLAALENHISRARPASLIALQDLFARPRHILAHLARFVDKVRNATSNEQLASILHHAILHDESDAALRPLSTRILAHVAAPALELVGEWIGLRDEAGHVAVAERGSFVGLDDDGDFVYRSEMMARFIAPEDAETIFETGRSLRVVRQLHPEHPLADIQRFGERPQLEWAFEWTELDAIATRARAYEDSLHRAMWEIAVMKQKVPPVPETHADLTFEQSIEQLNAAPSLPEDPYTGPLLSALHPTTTAIFPPPLATTPTLSLRPLIAAQAKLINTTTLRLLFRSHDLRTHLSLQHTHHLLTSGVFASLLSSALFDPSRESAERANGRMRSGVNMGLQLGSRGTWPPASSELRLALRGVLSESYDNETDSPPGDLNFAIRTLSTSEQSQVMDPAGIAALDFLRLSYTPPPPLGLILTEAVMIKYDTAFRFLLRLLRAGFVVAHLPRAYPDPTATRTRLLAHHFVSALSAYVYQSAIPGSWDRFDAFVSKVESHLDADDCGASVNQLRDAHAEMLDQVLENLLLRRKQSKVSSLLQEILGLVLRFAESVRAAEENETRMDGSDVARLYAELKSKIHVFTEVCRGLAGKGKTGGGKARGDEDAVLARLVAGIEGMGGWC